MVQLKLFARCLNDFKHSRLINYNRYTCTLFDVVNQTHDLGIFCILLFLLSYRDAVLSDAMVLA